MSDAATPDTEAQRTVQIPSLLTNSLRAVLEAFGENIVKLRASGSIETTNGTRLEALRDYGVSWEQTDKQAMTIDYEQLPGADGPANPLDETARQSLLDEVQTRVDPPEPGVDGDLAVTQMTVRVNHDRLQEVTPAQSPEFDLRFVSDPVEPPAREPTKRRNLDRRLYDALGFKCHNLNLRSVVETETKYHQQSDGKYLSWGGPSDIRPRSPERLAIRISDDILPGEYGTLKPYRVTDNQVIELAESDFDTEGNSTDKTRGGDS
jgi:hypothetical protein